MGDFRRSGPLLRSPRPYPYRHGSKLGDVCRGPVPLGACAMKKRWLSLLFTGLVLAVPLSAQAPIAARPAAPVPAPAKKALFWKVSSGENVAYLVGSIHLGSKEMYPLAEEFENAFQRSAVLIVEVDINHVD